MIPDAGLLLQNQAMRMVLDPLRGGAIRELSWRGRPLLRPTPAQLGTDPFDTACFPMVPYVNRVGQGCFVFDGRSVRLARNWSRDPHPLHGQGWRVPWSVVRSSETAATLQFEGGGNDRPWKYVCEQRCQLLAEGLLVELSVTNAADSPMPAMLGLHPYFPDAGCGPCKARCAAAARLVDGCRRLAGSGSADAGEMGIRPCARRCNDTARSYLQRLGRHCDASLS
jgi:galactose mutarotase-like enzyme